MIRKDYFLERWVYYSSERNKRPREFQSVKLEANPKICFFCPGNENLTPPEIGRLGDKRDWKMRWFLNKFPAVSTSTLIPPGSKKFLVEKSSYGVHEVVVETNDHNKQLADLPAKGILELFKVCSSRINELEKLKGIRYVSVFKNCGENAGTSLIHSHTQIVAITQIPALVSEKLQAVKKHAACPYCKIVRIESKSKRKIFETKRILAFAPFASRFNYEAWIFPKKHKRNLNELNEAEFSDLAIALKKILVKLKAINASYNFFFHYSPKKEDLHFHIEITPRISTWGGFEISTDAFINSVLPEDAAGFYRNYSK